MGFFDGFASPATAFLGGRKKRDSRRFEAPENPGFRRRGWRESGPPRNPAAVDVEDVAGGADFGKRRGGGAGQPDLRAELAQFAEQRAAPAGVEMGDDFVKQQERDDPRRLGDERRVRQDQ